MWGGFAAPQKCPCPELSGDRYNPEVDPEENTVSLSAIAIAPTESTEAEPYLFVGLHGWGANAQDLATLAPYMQLADCPLRFPDAPLPHPYAPGGRMWYGFPENYDFSPGHDFEAQSDLQTSRQLLTDWLHKLGADTGIPLERTILAGFSQGGAMTLDVGLSLPLAGLIVMSGYLHGELRQGNPPPPPVIQVHGRQDPVVPVQVARQTQDQLAAAAIAVEYYEFDMGHEIQLDSLAKIRSFVQQIRDTPHPSP